MALTFFFFFFEDGTNLSLSIFFFSLNNRKRNPQKKREKTPLINPMHVPNTCIKTHHFCLALQEESA